MFYTILCISSITFLYYILHLLGIGCPIKFITGISCAGCGMTRAWIAVFHLDMKQAFYYHPVFFLPVIYLGLLSLKRYFDIKIYKLLNYILIIIFVIVYVVRMTLVQNNIVVFQPQRSILYRLFEICFY